MTVIPYLNVCMTRLLLVGLPCGGTQPPSQQLRLIQRIVIPQALQSAPSLRRATSRPLLWPDQVGRRPGAVPCPRPRRPAPAAPPPCPRTCRPRCATSVAEVTWQLSWPRPVPSWMSWTRKSSSITPVSFIQDAPMTVVHDVTRPTAGQPID